MPPNSVGDSSARLSPEKGAQMLSHGAEADHLPSFRRKKTVNKLLSHQEFEHWRQRRRPFDIQVSDAQDPPACRNPSQPADDCDPRPEGASISADDDTPYSVYSDDKGEDVYCVDVEVSDDDDGDGGYDTISPRYDSIPLVMPITIPRVVSVGDKRLYRGSSAPTRPPDSNDENQQLHDIISNPTKTTERPRCSGEAASVCVQEDDPPIIQQLRVLLKLNDGARERLAVANWECLVSLIRLATSHSRLATVRSFSSCSNGFYNIMVVN